MWACTSFIFLCNSQGITSTLPVQKFCWLLGWSGWWVRGIPPVREGKHKYILLHLAQKWFQSGPSSLYAHHLPRDNTQIPLSCLSVIKLITVLMLSVWKLSPAEVGELRHDSGRVSQDPYCKSGKQFDWHLLKGSHPWLDVQLVARNEQNTGLWWDPIRDIVSGWAPQLKDRKKLQQV